MAAWEAAKPPADDFADALGQADLLVGQVLIQTAVGLHQRAGLDEVGEHLADEEGLPSVSVV